MLDSNTTNDYFSLFITPSIITFKLEDYVNRAIWLVIGREQTWDFFLYDNVPYTCTRVPVTQYVVPKYIVLCTFSYDFLELLSIAIVIEEKNKDDVDITTMIFSDIYTLKYIYFYLQWREKQIISINNIQFASEKNENVIILSTRFCY